MDYFHTHWYRDNCTVLNCTHNQVKRRTRMGSDTNMTVMFEEQRHLPQAPNGCGSWLFEIVLGCCWYQFWNERLCKQSRYWVANRFFQQPMNHNCMSQLGQKNESDRRHDPHLFPHPKKYLYDFLPIQPPIIIIVSSIRIAAWCVRPCIKFPAFLHIPLLYSAIIDYRPYAESPPPSTTPMYPPIIKTLSLVEVVA